MCVNGPGGGGRQGGSCTLGFRASITMILVLALSDGQQDSPSQAVNHGGTEVRGALCTRIRTR